MASHLTRSMRHLARGLTFALAALAIVAAVAARMSAAGPDPSQFYLRSIDFGGAGCPQGTVGQALADTRTIETTAFDMYIAVSGPSIPATELRKNCQLNFNFNVPGAPASAVVTLTTHGFAQLKAGQSAEVKSVVSWNGDIVKTVSTTVTGPTSSTYTQTASVLLTSSGAVACTTPQREQHRHHQQQPEPGPGGAGHRGLHQHRERGEPIMSGRVFTRSRRGWAAAAVVAVVIAGVPSTLRAAGPDPDTIYIKSMTYGGSGCPQGTVGTSFSDDRSVFTMIFDRFIAVLGNGAAAVDSRKNCVITLNLNAPAGTKWAVTSLDFRGFVELDTGVSATARREFFVPSGIVSTQTDFSGPTNKDYLLHDEQAIKTDATTCGGSALLTVDTQVALTNVSGDASATGQITDDSVDGKFEGSDVAPPGFALILEPCTLPDRTPPVITSTSTPAPNGNGWNKTNVTVSFVCNDSGSGVNLAASQVSPVVLTASGEADATCIDNAGNAATASVAVLIDKVAPTITVSSPSPNGLVALGISVPVTKVCADALSGIDICAGADQLDTSHIGSFTYTVLATDRAGNSRSTALPYRVGGKDECKKDGWSEFTVPTFRNQGQCVSFMEH